MAILLACCGAMRGCGGTPVGQGPIEFGPKMQASYDQYLRRVGPGAFVVGRRGGYYSYCPETGCVPGMVSLAMQLCRRNGDTDCRLYDVGGQVVWRRDLPVPGPGTGTAISAEVQTERDRNAAKVDCSRQLKSRLPAALNAQLAATLAVKESRVAWTFCDRLVEAVAGGTMPVNSLTDLAGDPLDEAEIGRLAAWLRPAEAAPVADAS
jgi:hypothetical protein